MDRAARGLIDLSVGTGLVLDERVVEHARIAIPMGGNGRGTYVLPEIEDQVLVVFEHGDIDRPIVSGGLWSNRQEPVEVNQSGKNNTKLIKSRSGHGSPSTTALRLPRGARQRGA
jgi:uncharacterized protein involved in type VI secretion and phage assembly